MKTLFLLLFGIFIVTELFSQEMPTNYWTGGTAYTLAKHRFEIGLFTGSRYGITDKLELSTRPLLFLLAPQVKIKKSWGEYSGFSVATEHGFLYPTQILRLVARKGIGGLISGEFTIPEMFAIDNRLRISYKPFKNTILSANAGLTFAVKFNDLDSRTTIDLPVIYPRLAVFYNQPEFDLGIDFRGEFSPRFGFIFNVENFILANTTENYFLENKGILTYTSKKQSLRVEGGYQLCYGKYPSGSQWHLLPVIALIFGKGK